jgi:hypothetical protein
MKRILVIVVASVLVSGCATQLGLQIGSTGRSATEPSVGPGGSFTSSGVGARLGEGDGIGRFFDWLFGRERRGAN